MMLWRRHERAVVGFARPGAGRHDRLAGAASSTVAAARSLSASPGSSAHQRLGAVVLLAIFAMAAKPFT